MGVGFSIVRAFARLNAMGALSGSAALLIICCLSAPVYHRFNFSETDFADGGKLELGIWGACYTTSAGNRTCSSSAVGYSYAPIGLPNVSPPSGTTPGLATVIHKPLATALIFFPLAVGATLLTLLFSLVPARLVTLMALGSCFLAIGANMIAAGIALSIFLQANAKIPFLFAPPTFAQPKLGRCIWFALAALVAQAGAFLFLVIALEPPKVSSRHPNAYQDLVYEEGLGGTDYSRRYAVEKHQRPRDSAYVARSQRQSQVSNLNNRGRAAEDTDRPASTRYVASSTNAPVKREPSRTSHQSRRSAGTGRLKAELEAAASDSDEATTRHSVKSRELRRNSRQHDESEESEREE